MTMYAIKGPEEDRIDQIVQSLQSGEGDLDGVIFRLQINVLYTSGVRKPVGIR